LSEFKKKTCLYNRHWMTASCQLCMQSLSFMTGVRLTSKDGNLMALIQTEKKKLSFGTSF